MRERFGQVDRHVDGQHRALRLHLGQHPGQTAPLGHRHHAHQAAQRHRVLRAEAEHPQRLGRQLQHARCRQPVVQAGLAPVEAAHAGQVLRTGQFAFAALKLLPGARRAQHVAQAARQQAPLRALDEKISGTHLVGAGDRGLVVQAGEHQHRHVLEARRGPQRMAGVEAVEARHYRVEHDDVRRPVGQHGQRALTAVGLGDLEAPLAQGFGGEHQRHLVVVDQQNLGSLGRVVGVEGVRQDHRAFVDRSESN